MLPELAELPPPDPRWPQLPRPEAHCVRFGSPEWWQCDDGSIGTAMLHWAATEKAEAALHLCESCPLRKPSPSWALTIPSLLDTAGIWAATTPHQRTKLRHSPHAA